MKVQNEMATRISIDTISAITSMRDFRSAVSAASSAWRAQEQVLKSSGQYSEALKTRINGLSQVMEIQKAKIAELRSQQTGLNQENAKQRSQWLNLEKQISQANKQLSGYENQLSKAKNSSAYYISGLAEMQRQYRLNNDVAKSYVASLRAQGESAKADREELKSLETALTSLKSQQKKQQFMLTQIEHSSGKASDAYKKQQIQLNQTGEAIGRTNARAKELNEALKAKRHPGWQFIRNDILNVEKAEERAKQGALNFGSALKANIMGGWLQQGFSSMVGGLKGIITNGMAAAKAGSALQARWTNIGLSAKEVKLLSDQVTDLKTNTNLTAQTVNSLQSRFYGMTHSVDQTMILTKGVASLSDQLKLSDQQANAFAGGLSRIESSGKVTSQSLGRLEKQAPGLTTAMSKASGMSQDAFKNLVSSGKMTSDQFNQILAKASEDYDKNAKAFGQTSGGAMHRLQQQWTSTQAKLAKPLLKVSATGLNELNTALNNKDTQRGLQMLAKYMAEAAVDAAKFIGYLAKHQKTVAVFGGAILGVAGALKVMQGVLVTVDIVKNFAKLRMITSSIKGLGVAVKVATAGFNPWVIAIEAVVVGFTLLYKHSKKFRSFINGLAKSAQTGMKKVGHWFSNTFNSIGKNHQKFVKKQQRERQRDLRDSQRTWQTMSRNVSRASKNMWDRASRDTRNGWNHLARWGNRSSKDVAKMWNWMNQETTKTASSMFRKHKQTFKAGYKVIEDQTQTWRDLVSGHWGRLADDTRRTANDMNKFHQRLFKGMYNKLNDMTGGRLGDMVKAWRDKMGSIGDTVANAKKAIHTHFVDLVRGIIKPFNDMLADLQKGINWVLDKLGASKIGGSWQVPMPSYATGTGDTHPGGLAMVNDGKTGHYREMYRLPNGQVGMFPAVRDMIVPLPKGTSVLDGERSFLLAQLLGQMPRYADGIGSFFSGIIEKGKDILEDVDKILAHPIQFVEDVFKKFVNIKTPVKFAQDLVVHVPMYIAKQMGAWIKKQFSELASANSPAGTMSKEAFQKAAELAAASMGKHLSASDIARLYWQAWDESNVNPAQGGGIDDHDGTGRPIGMFQFKLSTWRSAVRAMGGRHSNIHSAVDQIAAVLADRTWRSDLAPIGVRRGWTPHGYANGGRIDTEQFIRIAEQNKPEYVIPTDINKRSRAYQLLGEVVARFKGEEPSTQATRDDQPISKNDFMSLESKLDQLHKDIQLLINLGTQQVAAIHNQGKFDPKRQDILQAQRLSMKLNSF
nr:tape measure protein [Limosilactobacillus mucosae]